MTRSDGCGCPLSVGVAQTRDSLTRGPESHVSTPAAGRLATQSWPPMTKCAAAVGQPAAKVPVCCAAAVMAYTPFEGTCAETIANRIDPSDQRVFTSVCVERDPTWTPDIATPAGSESPKVAHPVVSV